MDKEKENLVDCHACNGTGQIVGIFPRYSDDVPQEQRKRVIVLPCQDCNGTGKLPEKSKVWRILGEKLFDARIAKRITLKKASELFNIDCVLLSKMERGIVEPDQSLVLKLIAQTGE